MNLIEEEIKATFAFFYECANHDESSPGYGLIMDDTQVPKKASIASVGFGLSAYIIGVEHGFITRAEARKLVKGTFLTFLHNVDHFHGFFVHYLDMDTAKPYKKSEYSTIDTAIFLNGAITCDAYFHDSEIHDLFQQIYDRVDWEAFVFDYKGKQTFHMAYNPNEGGDYRQHSVDPWIYHWHMFAEQLSMYVLAAGSDHVSASLALDLFNGFEQKSGSYEGIEYVYSPTNALFIYQYSHAWVDFGRYLDMNGFDWFENSRRATYANRAWCINHRHDFPIFSDTMWGITACLTPKGYRNQGVMPSDVDGHQGYSYGVIPPSGPAGSIVFAPEIVLPSIEFMRQNHPEAFGKYGFTDGIMQNTDGTYWHSEHYIGINKGITILMLDNYLHHTTWTYYHQHPIIQKAVKKLAFKER